MLASYWRHVRTIPPNIKALANSSDSSAVDLRYPAVVAYFFKSQADVDTSTDLAAALDDLQTYLGNVHIALVQHHVQVRDVYADTLRVRQPDGTEEVYHIATSDSDFVGYRFFRLGRPPMVIRTVLNDLNLMDAARRYCGWE